MNNKGFSLVEALVTIAILSILIPIFTSLFLAANQKITRLTNLVNTPQVSNKVVVTLDRNCQHLDGIYYGLTLDGNTLKIYTDSNCSSFLGTLDRLNNETWYNETTGGMWLVFANTSMKLLVIK